MLNDEKILRKLRDRDAFGDMVYEIVDKFETKVDDNFKYLLDKIEKLEKSILTYPVFDIEKWYDEKEEETVFKKGSIVESDERVVMVEDVYGDTTFSGTVLKEKSYPSKLFPRGEHFCGWKKSKFRKSNITIAE